MKQATKAERAGAKITEQIMDAKKGDRIVYHTGHLYEACQSADIAKRDIARAVRAAAWDAHERGICSLVQRRVGPPESGVCEYIAERR